MDPDRAVPWPALCQRAPSEMIAEVLSKASVDKNGCCPNGANAYFYAIQRSPESEALKIIKVLHEHDVPVVHSDRIKQTALFYAARDKKLECCKFFLDAGIDASQKDAYGQTALFYAAREGHVSVARLLVKHGAPVDSVDSLKSETPLFYCASQGQKEMVSVFLNEFHCDPLVQNRDGRTASAVARRANHKGVYSMIDAFVRQKQSLSDAGASHISKESDRLPPKKRYRLKMYGPLNEWIHPTLHKIEEFELRYPKISVWDKTAPLPTVKPSMDPFKARWHKLAVDILKDVYKYEGSEHFRAPVDVNKWNIRHYLDIVKKPMDFGTIRKKLLNNEYDTVQSFLDEMELVFENCATFNGKDSEFGLIGLNVRSYFHNLATCKGIYLLSQQEKEIEHDALRAIAQLKAEINADPSRHTGNDSSVTESSQDESNPSKHNNNDNNNNNNNIDNNNSINNNDENDSNDNGSVVEEAVSHLRDPQDNEPEDDGVDNNNNINSTNSVDDIIIADHAVSDNDKKVQESTYNAESSNISSSVDDDGRDDDHKEPIDNNKLVEKKDD